jgi:hypothetical protein
MFNSKIFNPKIAVSTPSQMFRKVFTPKNTNFQNHLKINRKMREDYLDRIEKSGEEPTDLADQAFGMGQFYSTGPHPSLLGRGLDQFFNIRLRPKAPDSVRPTERRDFQQRALAVNPEFPKIDETTKRNPGSPYETTLGHLLQTPSFMVPDEEGTTRTLGSIKDSDGNAYDNHPTLKILKGGIIERRLYSEAMGRLENHPSITNSENGIDWTPESHKAVSDEVQRFKKNVHELYHGNGVTLQNGTRVKPLYLSRGTADFISDVDEHFEPHPDDEDAWSQARSAFSNVTKGSGIRTMRDRAHSPLSQIYDTSFQRRIEESNDETLKSVFKDHLGETWQHRYISDAPVESHPEETQNWKTALEDRLRPGSRGLGEVPESSESDSSLKTFRTRNPRRSQKFFFNTSNSK